MSFKEIANSNLIWGCVIVGIILVALITMYYYFVYYKRALAIGIEKSTLKTVIKSSISFSIVPSLAIVVGIASLAVVIGLPYSWFRLSVLGSVAYELMAANMALQAIGVDVATADGYAFGLMAWAMCIAITSTLLFNIFFAKKMHMGTLKIGAGDKKWSALGQSVFMTALFCALLIPMLSGGAVSLLTFATSAAIGITISGLAKALKWPWLSDFVLAISLFGAMVSSVFWSSLF
ncbi:MAG: DUF5058 family protein [Bacteroidales bacterium]